MPKVLFVCTGNTCRSSMAEGLAKSLWELYQEQLPVEFRSAGVAALPGMPASPHAVAALGEKHIDISTHTATQISPQLIDEAELVLTMTKRHKQALLNLMPTAKDKIRTLAEYAIGEERDILDPYGQDLGQYRRCATELELLLKAALEKIRTVT